MRPRTGHRFRGIALRLSVIVGAATLVATLFISGVSLLTIQSVLGREAEQKFDRTLWSASERLDGFYAQREVDLRTFAESGVVAENLRHLSAPGSPAGKSAVREVATYLGYVLEAFPQYEAVFLLAPDGTELISAGEPLSLEPSVLTTLAAVPAGQIGDPKLLGGRRVQLVSTPLSGAGGRRVATLHAALDLDAMVALLQEPIGANEGQLYLIDPFGAVLGLAPESTPASPGTIRLAAEESMIGVVTTDLPDGGRVVASAVRFGRHGWTLVVQEPYEAAFAPFTAAVRRVGGLNMIAAFLASLGSLIVVAWRVKPILDLADGAQRLSEGETDVHVPVPRGGGEIQLLAHSFNEMSHRLLENRRDLEAQQEEIAAANKRLTDQNEELRSANEVLEQLSITDGLTRLHNHRYFQDQFAREAKRADRTGQPLSLILIDIDDFKKLNDELGHAAGDTVLQYVANALTCELRDSDFLSRYGGEEFALLAPQTELEGAVALAEKLRLGVQAAEFPVVGPKGRVRTTVSVGVAEHGGNPEATFQAADRALYEAKGSGKDCVISGGRVSGSVAPV
ncbi:MAG: diguanylate cyclase [Myxococcales bacterium]|nr:diguanylate cyclase [Myxococcales bacterium]